MATLEKASKLKSFTSRTICAWDTVAAANASRLVARLPTHRAVGELRMNLPPSSTDVSRGRVRPDHARGYPSNPRGCGEGSARGKRRRGAASRYRGVGPP